MAASLYDSVKEAFQNILFKGGVKEDTIADMEVNGVVSAHQYVMLGAGNMSRAIHNNDVGEVVKEVDRLLRVKCGQTVVIPEDAENLTTLSFLMPKIKDNESNTLLSTVSLSNAVHFSEQFPPGFSSTEQKQDFSIGRMISTFNGLRPGVLKPSSRPSNAILNGCLQFALTKAGVKDNQFAITGSLPNFSKLAMKSGETEQSVGGEHSKLVQRTEGGEVEPRSIGAVGKLWNDFLRYAQAMMNVKMKDGSVYGQEAGFILLEECFSLYASQRATVAAVCGALTAGWRHFTDELCQSEEDFVSVCRSMKRAGIWVEPETNKRGRDNDDDGAAGRKQLQTANNKLKQQLDAANRRIVNAGGQNITPTIEPGNGAKMIQSTKPCFDYFANKKCSRNPCPFRHGGEPPSYNPAKEKKKD